MRTSGILMPIFSLDSPYGIGTFGKCAYEFVDFLEKAGQSFWQILPLCPTNYGDSPYQSFSSFAGNPYFIDLDMLISEGLLLKKEVDSFDFGDDPGAIDYGKLYENRLKLLRVAYKRFSFGAEYADFCQKNSEWLEEYVLFMALKNAYNDVGWNFWDKKIRDRKADAIASAKQIYADDMEFYRFVQYKFAQQWYALKSYANKHGVRIIGDIPIYVALDSADVWSDRKQFLLDDKGCPKLVAGCPPDAFSEDGQLWGNPIYDWKQMRADKYKWWKRRLAFALKLYDVVRIDHFRGFEAFYSIPYGEKTAVNGSWNKGPGIEFFDELKKEFGSDIPIIAEDLGLLTPDVHKLLDACGFPGMKVMQFAFSSGEESDYLPHKYDRNCVVYTGTHDNDTIIGWTKTALLSDVEYACKYLHARDNEGFNWAMIRAAMMSVADTAIFMMPDFIGLGSEGRINTPSTLGNNWMWRIQKGCINDWLAGIIRENTALYGRLAPTALEKAPLHNKK